MSDANLLGLDVILKIISGNENAIKILYNHYDSWMRKVCTSLRYDYSGNAFYYFDDEEYQELRTHLYFSAIKFRVY